MTEPVTLADAGALAAILHAAEHRQPVTWTLEGGRVLRGDAQHIGASPGTTAAETARADIRSLCLFVRPADGRGLMAWFIADLVPAYLAGQFIPHAIGGSGQMHSTPVPVTRPVLRNQAPGPQPDGPPVVITPELISAARAWIADCYWGDLEPESVADLTDAEITDGIRRHYGGGWPQFVQDGNPDSRRTP